MAELRKRLGKILKEGPGNKKGWIRDTATDGTIYEISLPYEDGFRKSGFYIRIALCEGKLFSTTYDAGATTFPKSVFIGCEFFRDLKPISPTDLEIHISNLTHGRT